MNREELTAKVLKALGHPIRYKIVMFLLEERKCVCELNNHMDFSQANLSQHLKILKDAGLVTSEKEGSRIFYSLSHDDVKKLVHCANQFTVNYIKMMGENIL